MGLADPGGFLVYHFCCASDNGFLYFCRYDLLGDKEDCVNIKTVIFPKAKDRPKTKYLKLGFARIGIPVETSDRWMKRIPIPKNALGPYVYPIEFHFDKGNKLILYDINTTSVIFHRLLNMGWPYFKIHVKPADIKKFKIIPAPNTPSTPDFLDQLPALRYTKDNMKEYDFDFFFSGWVSANGLRIKACQMAKRLLRDRAYCGLQDFKHHRAAPAGLKEHRIAPAAHWFKQARSKINLALPGGAALPWVSFRHVELWGIGAAVFTYAPDYYVFKTTEFRPWIAFQRDFSNFEERLNRYLKHDSEREEIAAAGRYYFDQYYFPEKQAQYFIEKVEGRMKG